MEKNEIKESNIYKEIKRYPFNGRSNYLIDKFYIIGYSISTLHKLLLEENGDHLSEKIITGKKQNEEEKNKSPLNIQQFHLKEKPTLLNEITSDFNKECLELDTILDMILPNEISLYYSEKDLSSYQKENRDENENENDEFSEYEEIDFFDNELLKDHTVVFSSNPQAENNTKKSINGLGYIFYKKLKKRKILSKKVISFYIPIIFSIISEYPFYNGFFNLCEQIRILFSYPKKEIPIEILLYQIVNNTQSPINGDVILSIKPFDINDNNNNQKVNDNKITNSIEEVINENDEFESILDLKKEKSVPMKKSDFIKEENMAKMLELKNDSSFKSFDSEDKKINKMFKKRKSQLIEDAIFGDLPSSYIKRLEMIQDLNKGRKSRKTFSNKIMNLNKGKKKMNLKSNNSFFNNCQLEEIFPKIKFEFLSGYPLINYNLAKVLLYTLSPADIIEIFFYTFLEKDVIFFSKNLSYLSLTINSYLNLNFPLNDEKYYFINASVSYENYMNNDSQFVGATFTKIIGINDQYQPKYINSQNKLRDHLAVDLDKGELYKVEDKNNKEGSKNNKMLFSLIRKICNKKEQKSDKKQTILSREVYILNKKLNEINSSLNRSNEGEIENNLQNQLFKNGEFLEYNSCYNDYIRKTNFKIQDAFYRLINNLCLYFYQNLSIKSEGDDIKMKKKKKGNNKEEDEINVIFRDDYKYEEGKDKTYTKEEFYFLEELRETMKYESFVYSFVQSYSPIDLYKIPLTFTEEFLSIISRKSSILEKNINFFEIIDRLYENKTGKMINVDFNPFYIEYNKEYKKYLDREIDDTNEENILNEDLIKIKNIPDENKNKKYLKYKDYELDNNLLMKYLSLVDNLDKGEYNQLCFSADIINNNIPRDILVIDVENLIEKYSIETQLLSKSDLCCSNIILLLSLSLNFLDPKTDCQSFLGILFNEFTIFRKYYSYIMNMIYLLFNNCIQKQNYFRAQFYLILFYICLNSIRNLKLVPNESLMNIIKKFNALDLDKFHENVVQDPNSKDISYLQENNTIQKEKQIFQKEELTKKNLFLCYNFTMNRTVNEKEILEKINEDININIENESIQPKIKYKNNILKVDSFFYTQTSMITQLIKEYNKFIVDLNERDMKYKLLVDSCLNILIYMRNFKEFDNKEIKGFIEDIFFLFLNKYTQIAITFSENLIKK